MQEFNVFFTSVKVEVKLVKIHQQQQTDPF